MHNIVTQLYRFRREAVIVWRALWLPSTPLYLKLSALALAVYVLSPIDLVPDYIPVLGWIDDVVLVPLVVSWIVSKLPEQSA